MKGFFTVSFFPLDLVPCDGIIFYSIISFKLRLRHLTLLYLNVSLLSHGGRRILSSITELGIVVSRFYQHKIPHRSFLNPTSSGLSYSGGLLFIHNTIVSCFASARRIDTESIGQLKIGKRILSPSNGGGSSSSSSSSSRLFVTHLPGILSLYTLPTLIIRVGISLCRSDTNLIARNWTGHIGHSPTYL